MKRGGPEHPKVRRLKRRLQIGLAPVVGILELLYHWVAKYAPSGDVGRFEDADIEDACAWEGEPGVLVHGLLHERILDDDPEHRLVLHGWSEHADDAVHAHLARAGRLFADGTMPKLGRLAAQERAKCEPILQEALRQRMVNDGHAHGERTTDVDDAHDERTTGARRDGSPAPPPPAPPVVEDSAVFASAQTADRCDRNGTSTPEADAHAAASFTAAYHEYCPQLAHCREITPKRRQKIATRLREHDLDWWRGVFRKINDSPFLRGENPKGWRPDLDWLTRNSDNALRVLEGSYDGPKTNQPVRHQRFADHSNLFRREPTSPGGDA